MTGLESLPPWLAIVIAGFVVLGASLTLIGAYGFMRLRSFYDRLHAPTLATSWGTGGIVLASMLLASRLQNRTILHELVIGLSITATVPVTLMLLGRAALHRDRLEAAPHLPDHLQLRRPDTDTDTNGDTPPSTSAPASGASNRP